MSAGANAPDALPDARASSIPGDRRGVLQGFSRIAGVPGRIPSEIWKERERSSGSRSVSRAPELSFSRPALKGGRSCVERAMRSAMIHAREEKFSIYATDE
jgi:hypothetical protein